MNAHLEHHPALSLAEREALDEELFRTERSFDPAELPVYLPPVPEVFPLRLADPVQCVFPDHRAADSSDADRDTPCYPVPQELSAERWGAVSDGGMSYCLTSLAPGVYEVKQPRGASVTAEHESEETVLETVVPEFTDPVLETVAPEFDDPAEAVSEEEPVPEPDLGAGWPTEEPAPETDLAEESPAEEPAPAPVVPERRDLRVEVNAGLEVARGEETRVGPDVLRIGGAEGADTIDLMLLSPPMHGALLRDGSALTGGDVFTQGDVDAGRITYRHHGGPGRVDDSFGVATPDGEVPPTEVEIRVVVPRCAPRLGGVGTLEGVEDGRTASEILDGRAEAPGECGLAVVAVAGDGSWTCSHDGGQTWHPLEGIRPSRSLLLGPADRLRFASRPGTATVARLTYRAWDQSSHQPACRADLDRREAVGGATAFSQEVTTATLRIRPPVAPARAPLADPWGTPCRASELLGGAVAVVRLAGPGTWQYSVGCAAWRECRAVYHGRALLLGADDRLRFVPREGATGPVSLTVRSWDGDGARGGHARLSTRASVGGDTPFGESIQTADWYLDPIPPESPPQEPGVEGEG